MVSPPGSPDHFSARLEPEGYPGCLSIELKNGPWPAKVREKDQIVAEQKFVVAAPSQLRTIHASALPRSNLIEATLFYEGR
jgi:hypothetical protein